MQRKQVIASLARLTGSLELAPGTPARDLRRARVQLARALVAGQPGEEIDSSLQYGEVWERPVAAVEDRELEQVALGAIDDRNRRRAEGRATLDVVAAARTSPASASARSTHASLSRGYAGVRDPRAVPRRCRREALDRRNPTAAPVPTGARRRSRLGAWPTATLRHSERPPPHPAWARQSVARGAPLRFPKPGRRIRRRPDQARVCSRSTVQPRSPRLRSASRRPPSRRSPLSLTRPPRQTAFRPAMSPPRARTCRAPSPSS